MRLRPRVIVYVVRTQGGRREVLAFDAPNGTLQVPAGGIDPGESAEEAGRREAYEETGVRLDGPLRRVHVDVNRYSGIEVWRLSQFLVADAPAGLPEAWEHVVTGHGVENGRTFRCRWIPLEEMDRLAAGLGVAAFALFPRKPRAAAASIRPATPDDARFIAGLRNHAIRTSTAIYTDVELDAAGVAGWWDGRDLRRHPITIASLDGEPVGYGMLGPIDEKCGYGDTAEDSIYVADRVHRRGVGGALLADLIARGRAGGLRSVLARIDREQEASLGLHLRHGFDPAGVLKEAGHKFGRRLDVILLQRMLD